ncbi:hypothetical protein C8R44DRAFT_859879 [Mycena epipterygia]|nr:hypothetical protein C8R44DRAFT_859879 [Mycena epipterygia]
MSYISWAATANRQTTDLTNNPPLDINGLVAWSESYLNRKQTRRSHRVSLACVHCRKRKIRCSAARESTQKPCQRCSRKGLVCVYVPVSASASAGTPTPPPPPGFMGAPIQYTPSPELMHKPFPGYDHKSKAIGPKLGEQSPYRPWNRRPHFAPVDSVLGPDSQPIGLRNWRSHCPAAAAGAPEDTYNDESMDMNADSSFVQLTPDYGLLPPNQGYSSEYYQSASNVASIDAHGRFSGTVIVGGGKERRMLCTAHPIHNYPHSSKYHFRFPHIIFNALEDTLTIKGKRDRSNGMRWRMSGA